MNAESPYPTLLDLPNSKVRPLSEEEILCLVNMASMGEKPLPSSLSNFVGYQILKHRLLAYSCRTKIHDTAAFMLSVCTDRPGRWVMLAWMVHSWAKTYDFEREIDLNILAMEIIPNGIPTGAAFDELWDAQKNSIEARNAGRPENALDDATTWFDLPSPSL